MYKNKLSKYQDKLKQFGRGVPTISGDEELHFIKSNINATIEQIIELHYDIRQLNPRISEHQEFYEISTRLNINICIVEYVLDIQTEFLRSKGLVK
jgi:hypothetical protein